MPSKWGIVYWGFIPSFPTKGQLDCSWLFMVSPCFSMFLHFEAREKQLLPLYTSVATTFADLHDRAGRMKAKGVIKESISWKVPSGPIKVDWGLIGEDGNQWFGETGGWEVGIGDGRRWNFSTRWNWWNWRDLKKMRYDTRGVCEDVPIFPIFPSEWQENLIRLYWSTIGGSDVHLMFGSIRICNPSRSTRMNHGSIIEKNHKYTNHDPWKWGDFQKKYSKSQPKKCKSCPWEFSQRTPVDSSSGAWRDGSCKISWLVACRRHRRFDLI